VKFHAFFFFFLCPGRNNGAGSFNAGFDGDMVLPIPSPFFLFFFSYRWGWPDCAMHLCLPVVHQMFSESFFLFFFSLSLFFFLGRFFFFLFFFSFRKELFFGVGSIFF